ncbi:GGDEF domain-containing protein [Acetobacterium bakii]|uniref:GGDEF domain-containing protein n=1 Tax=Acetobacterium bakii TaxID=52689 RepID=UPI001A9A43A0|nr:GGDEF domain-containing protein [Acetobacterium bakii]
MNRKKSNGLPIYFGEFRDKALEKEFYNAEIKKNINYVKFILLLVGIAYFLFIIPDYFLITDVNAFMAILFNRSVILGLLVILYFKVKRSSEYFSLIYWFTAYEIIISLSFISIANHYTAPDFLIQAFGVMLIILVIFLINNRWRYSIFAALFVSIGYFVFAAFCFTDVPFSQFSAAIVHILIVIVLSSISSYSINYYKRIQYLNTIELLNRAENDSLTGIYNKAKFNKEYARLADSAQQKNADLSVVMFDIDNFKGINDQYGHLVGDAVLIALADIVRKNLQQSDIFARWGGEEFVLIFPNMHLQQAIEITERLRKYIADHIFEKIGQVTCSFGVAVFEKDEDLNKVLQRADERLYLAKNAGKNKVM